MFNEPAFKVISQLPLAASAELANSLASGETFIGFDEVRATGLKLRYDAASDRIVISS